MDIANRMAIRERRYPTTPFDPDETELMRMAEAVFKLLEESKAGDEVVHSIMTILVATDPSTVFVCGKPLQHLIRYVGHLKHLMASYNAAKVSP
jgi:hypothetical protein